MRARKAPNEPNWVLPLVVSGSGVNINTFGFAYAKRTQFPVVENRISAAAGE